VTALASRTASHRLSERLAEIVRFRQEEEGGERSWLCLLGGGALVLISAALIAFIAYETVYHQSAGGSGTLFWLGLAFFPYTTGVFVFCLGYEMNDTARAVKLTAVILVFSVVVVAAAAVALLVMAGSGAVEGAGAAAAGRGKSMAGMLTEVGPEGRDDELASQMYTLKCERCGELFAPVPPKAACPYCGWEAVTVAVGK